MDRINRKDRSLYTDGRKRRVVAKRMELKNTKQTTNSVRIYPPRTGVRRDLLAAADAAGQSRPALADGNAGKS